MKIEFPSLIWCSWFQTNKVKEVSRTDTFPFRIKVSIPCLLNPTMGHKRFFGEIQFPELGYMASAQNVDWWKDDFSWKVFKVESMIPGKWKMKTSTLDLTLLNLTWPLLYHKWFRGMRSTVLLQPQLRGRVDGIMVNVDDLTMKWPGNQMAS